MRGKLRALIVVLAGSLTLGAPLSSQAQTSQYTYYNGSIGGANLGSLPTGVDTPAGHVGALAQFVVIPSGNQFTISIDDFGTMDGSILASISSSNGELFSGCIAVRSTKSITGATANQEVRILIGTLGHDAPGDNGGCSAMATAGVATVGGVG
jgi:hypothetical protein